MSYFWKQIGHFLFGHPREQCQLLGGRIYCECGAVFTHADLNL